MPVKDYSTTPASNTTIGTINIAEGCAPGNVNNAQRRLMADMAIEMAATSTTASSTTIDVGALNGSVIVTGTTTITSFGTATAGLRRFVYFQDALTLTHNATSLILPGAINILTAAGDTGLFESLGSGNWRCIAYFRATGSSVNQAYAVEAASLNPIINPDFSIWQRGTTGSFGGGGGTSYLADRWVCYSTTAGSFTRSTDAATGFLYSIDITNGAVFQNIESLIAQNYAGKTVTVTVCAKRISGSGNFDVSLSYPGAADNWSSPTIIGSQTLTASLASSFTEYKATFGPLPSNVSNGLSVLLTSPGQYRICWVKVEEGAGTSGFKPRLPGQELLLCQRYYEKSYDLAVTPGTVTEVGALYGGQNSNGNAAIPIRYAAVKRTAPTLVLYNSKTGGTGTWQDTSGTNVVVSASISSSTNGVSGFTAWTGAAGHSNQGIGGHFTANAEI